jgi:hypothetical protein
MVPLDTLRAGTEGAPESRREEEEDGPDMNAPRLEEEERDIALQDDCMLLLERVAAENRPLVGLPPLLAALMLLPRLEAERVRSSCSASRNSAEADEGEVERGGLER